MEISIILNNQDQKMQHLTSNLLPWLKKCFLGKEKSLVFGPNDVKLQTNKNKIEWTTLGFQYP